jgi:outer membrane protein assembly factor BamA
MNFLSEAQIAQKAATATMLIFKWLCLIALLPEMFLAQMRTPRDEPLVTGMPEQAVSLYEGQMVSTVILAGRPDLDLEQLEPFVLQKANQPFSGKNVEQSAEALRTAGHIDQVRLRVQPDARGVRVEFVLEPAFWFGIYYFPGAERFPYSRLIQATNYPARMPYSSEEVEKDSASLKTFFQHEGFFQARVKTKLNVNAEAAIVDVEFEVALDKQAKFGTIAIYGAETGNETKLSNDLKGFKARARGAAIRPGKKFHRTTLDRATRYLQSLLVKQGYLGAQVKLEGAEYDPDTNRADIHFSIRPGVVTHVHITGAHVWSWTRKDILPVYQGVGIDETIVQEGQQALLSYFQSKGYFDVKVTSALDKGQNSTTLTYNITKEEKHKVSSVEVAGNTHLSSSQLMPSIAVEKKHFLSPGKFSDVLARKSVNNLTGIYKAEGFNDVKVTSSVQDNGKSLAVTFHVVEGPRNLVNRVSIEGAQTFSVAQFAPGGLRVREGQPYSAAHVAEDRATILANYFRAGYLNASFRETASAVSKENQHQVNVVYHISEGPRVTTGRVITLGRSHTEQKMIEQQTSAIQAGKPLTEQALLASESKLYGLTGVFDWAQVDPKQQVTTQTTEDVLVKLHEAKRNELQYGFGFEVISRGGTVPGGTVAVPNLPPVGLPQNFTTSQKTFFGPRGLLQYTRYNMRGKGETMTTTAFAGRLDQRFAFYYIDPDLLWSSWKATTHASFERNQENPIFSSRVETAGLEFQRPVDRARKNIVFLRYSYSKTDLTHVLVEELVPPRDQHIQLSTWSGNFTRDIRDNPMDEHRGMLESVELDINSSVLGSSVDFAKLTAQVAYYKEKFHRIVWANSLRIGLAQPFNDSFVPLSEAFFTGGSNTLRGFPLYGAGPQRAVEVCSNGVSGCNQFIQVPAGGNELLLLNSEARLPLDALKKSLGLVVFYDGGNVFPNIGFHDFTSLYSNNVGLGLRYATPVGPIRIDVGQNLNPVKGIKPTQYFITIGQAF